MIEFIQACFSNSLFRRLVLISLLPNIFVWGFSEVGINTKNNYIWVHFLAPYWDIEVFLFKIIAASAGVYVMGSIYFAIATEIKRQRETALEEENSRKVQESNRKQAEIEELKRKQKEFEILSQNRKALPPQPQQPKPLTTEDLKTRALKQIVDGF